MPLQGQIKEFGLPEIIQLIQIQKKDGMLTLRQGKVEAMVLFESGAVVMARLGTDDEWFAILDLMVRAKRITTGKLQESIKENKKIGETELGPYLVNKNIVEKEDLQLVIRLYIQETLFHLFTWKTGVYQFDARKVSYNKEYFFPLNTEFAMMEGMQRIDEWPQLHKQIPSKGTVFERTDKEVLSPQTNGHIAEDEFSFDGLDSPGPSENGDSLSREERLIYDMVDGAKTVSAMVDLSLLGEFPVYKTLVTLKGQGYIQQAFKSPDLPAVESEPKSTRTQSYGNLVFIWAVNGVTLVLLATLIFLSVRTIELNAKNPFSELVFQPFRHMQAWEKADRIQYALHLYHLRYQRFPDKLDLLVKERSLSNEDLIDPWGNSWHYQRTEKGFHLAISSGMAEATDTDEL